MESNQRQQQMFSEFLAHFESLSPVSLKRQWRGVTLAQMKVCADDPALGQRLACIYNKLDQKRAEEKKEIIVHSWQTFGTLCQK